MVQEALLDTPAGIYSHIVNSGIRKSQLMWDKMALSGLFAGIFVGLAGHVATKAGGGATDMGPGPQLLLYMILFPVGLVGVIWTQAELYTGNTMTMLVALLHCRIKWYHLIINWLSSWITNFIGALGTAYLLSYLTSTFGGEPYLSYIQGLAEDKTGYEIHEVFLKAIGCNIFVCFAIHTAYGCQDTAGKFLVIWIWIVSFGVAGFEHIVANMYTIPLGMMYGADVTIGELFGRNLVWTWLGNTLAGCLVVGVPQWWLHKDYYEREFPMAELDLLRKVSIRDDNSDTNPHTPMFQQARMSMSRNLTHRTPNENLTPRRDLSQEL